MTQRLIVEIAGDTSSLERALNKASGHSSAFGGLAKKALLGVGAGFVAAGVSSLNAAANYEQSLNTFHAVSKATGGQMKQVSTLAKALGNDMTLPATSARDAADAMTELAKGGLSVKDTMSAAKGVLQLSAAAQISNADAATITARALNSFGLAGSQATKVADLLAATSNASTSEISDLALGMSAASAVFKSGRQPIDVLTTSLGLMANAGIAGSDAGTSLKTMMLALQAPSKAGADKMKDLGISVRDAHGHMLPMRQLIATFTEKTRDMSDAQRDAAAKTIFGTDAFRAANVVMFEGVAAWDKMHKATTKGGEAADLAAAKTKGFKGAMEGFKSAIETLQITLGEGMLPVMTRFAQKLSAGAQFVNSFINAMKRMDSSLVASTSTNVTAANSMAHTGATMDAGTRAAYKHAETMQGLKYALSETGRAFVQIGNAVVNFGRAIYDGALRVRGFDQALGESLKSSARAVGDWASKLPARITAALSAVGRELSNAATWVRGMASDIGRAIVDGIVSGVGDLGSALKDKMVGGISGAFHGVTGAFKIHSPSQTAADEIGKPLAEGVILGWVNGSAALPAKMKESVRKAVDAARQMVDNARSRLGKSFSRFSGDALAAFDARAGNAKTPAEKALAALTAKHDAAAFARDLKDARTGLSDAQAAQSGYAPGEGDTPEQVAAQRKQLGQAIVEAQQRIDELLYDQERNALEKRAVQERLNFDAKTELRRRHFEDALNALGTSLEREGATVGTAHQKVISILASFGIHFKNVGADMGIAWIEGLKESIGGAAKGAGALSSTIAKAAASIPRGVAQARASGGPVFAGMPYIVGERGQELFVPNANGRIIPNGALAGGGGISVTVSGGTFLGTTPRELAGLLYGEIQKRAASDVKGGGKGVRG